MADFIDMLGLGWANTASPPSALLKKMKYTHGSSLMQVTVCGRACGMEVKWAGGSFDTT